MSERVVIPELLDHLPADDPGARRSRRDLRRINALMGNESWICKRLDKFSAAMEHGIVEIGAGDGFLSNRMARQFHAAAVISYDLSPRPDHLDPRVRWHQGDLFTMPPPSPGGVLVANLFLHHFEGNALKALGEWLEPAAVLVLNEPDRARFPHILGGILTPLIHPITRHDMHVSIRAGFADGEMRALLGLRSADWQWRETSTWRGSRRVVAWRT